MTSFCLFIDHLAKADEFEKFLENLEFKYWSYGLKKPVESNAFQWNCF